VKYWGKKPVQLPANPSLSMTLNRAYTELTLEYCLRDEKDNSPWIEFWFEGNKKESFEKKIEYYLRALLIEYPFIKHFNFKIASHNTFPHSTGIASSASSMSALGLCLAELIAGTVDTGLSYREASRLSRLASGSACRSVYGGYTIWGKAPHIEGTSDEYAIPLPFEINPVFREMKDAILVVSSKEKEVSSRAGHSLMEHHPYALARYTAALANIAGLCEAMESGDVEKFMGIVESEAFHLHALMMTSPQSYLLFESGTVNIIKAIRRFRNETSIPVCFTLDAGPNVHLLYPAANETIIRAWINAELVEFCENGRWIDDEIGVGPEKLE
jgi:diphosphomevalonate decarboxylase